MIEDYNDYFNKAVSIKSKYETLLNQKQKSSPSGLLFLLK